MELHSCHSCQLIDDVISSKLQNYDVLTEENLSLHHTLLKARESLVSLQTEIVSLNNVLVAERERNLNLYLKQLNQQNNSNVLMNVVLKTNAKDVENHFSYTKKVSFQPSLVHNSNDKYERLKNLYEEQTKIYEENLETLKNVNAKYVRKLEEELQKTRDHCSIILDMYSFYRKQTFSQKIKNAREHKDFLDTVDVLNQVNKKHIEEVERRVLEETTCAVNEQTRGALNSLFQQIHKRDKLVYMLRRQQAQFEKKIQQFDKQQKTKSQSAEKITNELKKQLQNEKKKYSALEQRRMFDFEGFKTDIQQFRKELTKLKNPPIKSKLVRDIDNIEQRLICSYLE
ncbi:hypothetical protein RN001_015870 [Aquatica leii]|uniref:Uncharacterized protein n=1 Tax=Aquatica leii TaxID=1421715 RepID=A0AAN7P107_9COLE|nr:hypothetical protein RN001_015870 [Aquatica leii]